MCAEILIFFYCTIRKAALLCMRYLWHRERGTYPNRSKLTIKKEIFVNTHLDKVKENTSQLLSV